MGEPTSKDADGMGEPFGPPLPWQTCERCGCRFLTLQKGGATAAGSLCQDCEKLQTEEMTRAIVAAIADDINRMLASSPKVPWDDAKPSPFFERFAAHFHARVAEAKRKATAGEPMTEYERQLAAAFAGFERDDDIGK